MRGCGSFVYLFCRSLGIIAMAMVSLTAGLHSDATPLLPSLLASKLVFWFCFTPPKRWDKVYWIVAYYLLWTAAPWMTEMIGCSGFWNMAVLDSGKLAVLDFIAVLESPQPLVLRRAQFWNTTYYYCGEIDRLFTRISSTALRLRIVVSGLLEASFAKLLLQPAARSDLMSRMARI